MLVSFLPEHDTYMTFGRLLSSPPSLARKSRTKPRYLV